MVQAARRHRRVAARGPAAAEPIALMTPEAIAKLIGDAVEKATKSLKRPLDPRTASSGWPAATPRTQSAAPSTTGRQPGAT